MSLVFKKIELTSILNVNSLKSIAARNAALSVFLKVVTSLLFLIMVPLSIRTIGPDQYGVAAFFLTMQGSVSLLDSGFSYALGLLYTRRLVHDETQAKDILYAAVPVYLTLALFAFVVFCIFASDLSLLAFNTEVYKKEMMIFGLVLALTVLDSMLGTVLHAHEKIQLLVTGRFLLDLVKVAGLGYLILSRASASNIIWFILLSTVVKLIFDLICFRKIISVIRIRFDRRQISQILRYAIPSVGIAVCSLMNSMWDKFLVSGEISSSVFTSYSFAVDLTTKSYFLMYAITTVVYPKLIKTHSRGQNPFELIKVQIISLLAIGLCYYLPLSVFSADIIRLLIGEQFVATTGVLVRLCSLSAVMYLAFTIVETYLYTTGSILWCLGVYVFGILVFLSCLHYLMFVRDLQVYGAPLAVAFMFLVMIVSGVAVILYKKKQANNVPY